MIHGLRMWIQAWRASPQVLSLPLETLLGCDSRTPDTNQTQQDHGSKGPRMSASDGAPNETPESSVTVQLDTEHFHMTVTCAPHHMGNLLAVISSVFPNEPPMTINPTSSKDTSDDLIDAREKMLVGWDHTLRCRECHNASITGPMRESVSIAALNLSVAHHWRNEHGYMG